MLLLNLLGRGLIGVSVLLHLFQNLKLILCSFLYHSMSTMLDGVYAGTIRMGVSFMDVDLL